MENTIKKVFDKALPLLLAALLLLSVMPLSVMAAGYEGRGTKSSPYLVKTAEQLADMSKKPAAHYKLAANIDLSGIDDFTPIGYLAKPFTGSFVCERNSDGSPKYIIKNLKIQVSGMPSHTDYIKNNSRWEAALFGATKGATLEGIAVVDFKIKNTVEGMNQMGYGSDAWHTNPGQDEMGAAGLVAITEDSTIKYCIAIGEIYESTANWCGGLIGNAEGGNDISYCYANVKIDTKGLWCHGTFMGGTHAGDKVSYCYSEGDLSKAAVSKDYSTGGFMGENGATVENCYVINTQVAKGGSSFCGNNSFVIKNCYTTATVVGSSKTGASTSNNNFCLNKSGCEEDDFKAASASDINKAFSSLSGWDTSGELPVIKDTVGKINASDYSFKAESQNDSQGNTDNTQSSSSSGDDNNSSAQSSSSSSDDKNDTQSIVSSQTGTSSSNKQETASSSQQQTTSKDEQTQSTPSEEQSSETDSQESSGGEFEQQGDEQIPEDEEEAESTFNVEDLAFLKEIRTENDITVEQGYIIIETMAKIIDMDPEERMALGEYMGLLSQYNTKAMLLVVSDFTEQVEALPEAKKLDSESAAKVKELYAKYEGFTDDVKAVFTEDTMKKLEELNTAAQDFGENTSNDAQQTMVSDMTQSEKLIVIILLSLSVLALLGAFTLITLNIVSGRKKKEVSEEEIEE